MSVKSIEKLEKSMVALTITVEAEAFEAAVEKAYRKMRSKINVPGFRPGKAPRKMIESMYGAEVFYNEAVDEALPEAYMNAVVENKLEVVGYPELSLEEVGKDGFTFKALVAVYPEVKLGKYKGISAPKAEVKVSADDVKQRLNEMAERNARLVSVDRKAKKGDITVIDFKGFDDGVAFEGGEGTNHELELGSGSFVPGFEDQIIGMKTGEEKDIDITFPEDYHAELAGKKVVFHVKVNEVKVKELPELDDEFAKDVSEFDTIKELKDDIKAKLTAEREEGAKRAFEDALMAKVAEGIEADVPQAMIDEQAARFVENLKAQIANAGIPFDQYLKMTNTTEAELLKQAGEPAERQVRLNLAMAEIVKVENIEVSDEEIEAEYTTLSEKFGMSVEDVKKYVEVEAIRGQLTNDKAIAVVVDNAKATKPAAKKAEGEEGEKKSAAKKSTKKAEGEEGEKKPAAKKTAKKAEGEEGEKKSAAKKTAKKTAENE
ncbi:MAG: trigger factor [Oscillospiraceae bacterium]|nr:trigger factor [Oscillospiraceae bacterium]